MKGIVRIKVFISSPSDVKKEREMVDKVIAELNQTDGIDKYYHLYCYKWERDMKSDWGKYQANIDRELEDTDIFIAILWSRLGTPTQRFASGTVAEFKKIKKLKDTGKQIELAFFRSSAIPKKGYSDTQVEKVKKFFKQHDNKEFAVKEYKTISDFESILRVHLKEKIKNLIDSKGKEIPIVNDVSLKANGIIKIYTPELNTERNSDKIKLLENEEEIYLLAHTGNAYFNTNEHTPFTSIIQEKIRSYKVFKIILLNPYSLEARKIFYAENFGVHNVDITNIKIKDGLDKGKNMKRFDACMAAIEELKSVNPNIEVRISNVATDGTILMSKKRLFFEPYLVARFSNRINQGLNIFEFQIENIDQTTCQGFYDADNPQCKQCEGERKNICRKNLYKTISEQFHILWNISIPMEEYMEQIPKFRETFLRDHDILFKNEIVQLHDSWFAFDPVIGCNNNCAYCFLGTNGWRGSNPEPRIRIEEGKKISEVIDKEYRNLTDNYLFKNSNAMRLDFLGLPPISIGNKTDILKENNREWLNSFIRTHNQSCLDSSSKIRNPVVLITKELISDKLINEFKNLEFPVYVFNSLSYLAKKFEPGVESSQKRLYQLKLIRKFLDDNKIDNVKLVQYWRPITDLSELNYEDVLNMSKGIFDCTIGIGLKVYDKLNSYFEKKQKELFSYIEKRKEGARFTEDEEILPEFYRKAEAYAKEIGHPFFKHTSCAISFLQQKADYNGSMWRAGFCKFCVPQQKEICDKFKKQYYPKLFKQANYNLGALTRTDVKDKRTEVNDTEYIFIDKELTQEEINLYTHISGKPIFPRVFKYSRVWKSSNQKYLESVIKRNYGGR